MTVASSIIALAGAAVSLLLASVSLARKKRSPASWFFFAGMMVLGLGALLTGLSLRVNEASHVVRLLTGAVIVESLVPVFWVAFSITYSRGNARESLALWRVPLVLFAVVPTGLSLAFAPRLFEPRAGSEVLPLEPAATTLSIIQVVAAVLVLMNLEQTFRATVGAMRWRIKFVALGIGVVFLTRLYLETQAILFSVRDLRLSSAEPASLLVGGLCLAVAYVRAGFEDIDVYPSRAVLRSSITVLVAGGYLVVVGVLSQVVTRLGQAGSIQLGAVVVLAGMAGLGVLLLSDRFRLRVYDFVAHHFREAQHDSIRTWKELTTELIRAKDEAGFCGAVVRFVARTFDTLSVRLWLLHDQDEQFVVAATTVADRHDGRADLLRIPAFDTLGALGAHAGPFNLDRLDEAWAEEWRRLNPGQFAAGGDRWCVALRAADRHLGVLVLADRVGGKPYSVEDLGLLACIAGQAASTLANLQLAHEVARARELDTFRAMSAFFVHDLKNTAASLNLTLKNLPVHFEDPSFRQDALRAVESAARRIDRLIARLSAMRQQAEFNPVRTDLNQLVRSVLQSLDGLEELDLTQRLQPLPPIFADRDQIESLVTNLVTNAREAVAPGGRIAVETERRGSRVVLSIADNGCGMSPAFLKDSLFRPFQTTKKTGLGIGMFQARSIVERHGGRIHVESQVGRGTTVRASFPVSQDRP